MASSLLALLDDIATVLDDVAVMTKVAAKKTAGVLGDEPSAQRAAGRRSLLRPRASAGPGGRKGSMLNKAILVRAALLLSAFVPWAVIPLMCSAVPSFASRAWRSWRTSSCTPRPSQSAKARSGQSRSCGTGATRTHRSRERHAVPVSIPIPSTVTAEVRRQIGEGYSRRKGSRDKPADGRPLCVALRLAGSPTPP